MGLSRERHVTNYHRVLNRDAWSCLAAGQVLLGLIVAVLPRDWPIVLAADDTLEWRGGRKIKARGCYRDPVRSSRKHVVKCFGLKWVVPVGPSLAPRAGADPSPRRRVRSGGPGPRLPGP